MKHFIFCLFSFLVLSSCGASNPSTKGITKVADSINGYWQQHVDYSMDIDMDVNNYQYKGKQKLVYTNNSPDVLNRVYYHLFFHHLF